MTARMRRLMSDYEQVRKDFAGHNNIIVTPIGDEPPEKYHVTYFVNGIYLLPDGRIETLGRHEPPPLEASRSAVASIVGSTPLLRFS